MTGLIAGLLAVCHGAVIIDRQNASMKRLQSNN